MVQDRPSDAQVNILYREDALGRGSNLQGILISSSWWKIVFPKCRNISVTSPWVGWSKKCAESIFNFSICLIMQTSRSFCLLSAYFSQLGVRVFHKKELRCISFDYPSNNNSNDFERQNLTYSN